MTTLRFKMYDGWKPTSKNNRNNQFIGLTELISYLSSHLLTPNNKMIEIGSYMGESTMMFASSGIFSTIFSIEPHTGIEEFNDLFGYEWDVVKKEYETNTRFFDNITHIKDFSHNIHDTFDNNSIDFIYIDGGHDYESIKNDLKLYLPKLKKNGIIAGHDYEPTGWPGVVRAIHEIIGEPDVIFSDSSWIKSYKTNEII